MLLDTIMTQLYAIFFWGDMLKILQEKNRKSENEKAKMKKRYISLYNMTHSCRV